MTEVEKIKSLTANAYRLYRFIVVEADEQGVLWDKTREELQEELGLGYTTVYKCLNELQDQNFIEYNGYKKMFRILK